MVFDYIAFACYFYVPNKANKKKIKQLMEAMPYFLPEKKQNVLFTIMRKYPIESFYDKSETMKDYGYIVYKDFMLHEEKRYLDYTDYNDKFLVYLYICCGGVHDNSTKLSAVVYRLHVLFVLQSRP
jgi:hypothetical protein